MRQSERDGEREENRGKEIGGRGKERDKYEDTVHWYKYLIVFSK